MTTWYKNFPSSETWWEKNGWRCLVAVHAVSITVGVVLLTTGVL